MAAAWIEKVTGPLEEKRRYRRYKTRVKELPARYRAAVEALERYLMYRGSITKGDVLVSMLDDLIELFEQSASDGTPVREIVGDDPVEFAETFLRNYSEGQWITGEQRRLTEAIDRVVGDSADEPGAGS